MNKYIKLIVSISIVWFIGFWIYVWYDSLNYKSRKYGVSTIEKELSNRYIIGYHWKEEKICDNFLKYGCLDWEILSYRIESMMIYIYYKPYSGYSTSNWKTIYTVFWPYDSRVVENINKIPNLVKMDVNSGIREFYHSSEISNLNPTDRKIFEELIRK